ncbi:MAG: ribosomal protein methyltransferase [Gammaproteobacteria bacterium]|jgi:ribosomal protein L11 methyltransferase|nr:ribosomal protein methyltransferase [Gammaproteobacteria bacterium]
MLNSFIESSVLQICFECPRKVAEPLSQFLMDTEALAVSLMDAADTPIFEPALNETPLWPNVKVVALFQDKTSLDEALKTLEQLLGQLPPYEIENVENRDWVSETQAQFQPMQIGEKLWIYPEWEKIPNEHQPAMKLAPGLAFGTGTHPTTKMCLEALSKLTAPGTEVIDFGCGSGILGIAALILGANKIYGVDIDPQAIEASQQNALLNNINAEKIWLGLPESFPAVKADIIVANILAKPLIDLKGIFHQHLKPDGKIILAGLLDSQAQEIITHYRDWKPLEIFMQQEEWVCLVG